MKLERYFWFILLTIIDVLIVELYYRPLQAWDAIWMHHNIYFILIGLVILFMAFRRKFFDCMILVMLFSFGCEDTLFYLIGHQSIPPIYYGVSILGNWEPTASQVLKMNGIIITVIYMLEVIRCYLVWKYSTDQ